MLAINLLPWRTRKREQEKIHHLLFGVAGLLLGILCWVMLHLVLNIYLKELATKKISLELKMVQEQMKAIKAGQLKNEYLRLQQQQGFIKQLKSNQDKINEELNYLSLMRESPLAFKEIHRSSQSLIMKGETFSFDQIILFISKWEKQNYFLPFHLKRFEHEKDASQYYFVLMSSMQNK